MSDINTPPKAAPHPNPPPPARYLITARYGAEGLREGVVFKGGIATTSDEELATRFRELGYVVSEIEDGQRL